MFEVKLEIVDAFWKRRVANERKNAELGNLFNSTRSLFLYTFLSIFMCITLFGQRVCVCFVLWHKSVFASFICPNICRIAAKFSLNFDLIVRKWIVLKLNGKEWECRAFRSFPFIYPANVSVHVLDHVVRSLRRFFTIATTVTTASPQNLK